jgi:hypothetical protein
LVLPKISVAVARMLSCKKMRVKKFLFGLMFLGLSSFAEAQDFGLSFSYFVPRNGSFSTPISPFSFRGVGVDLNRFVALETGITVYRMAGLGMRDLPFQSGTSLVGPNFTVFVPVELVFQLRGRSAEFSVKGGAFGFYGFAQRIDYGNMDRALRSYQNWSVANANLTFENKPGWGTHVGAELLVYVSKQFGISLETNYLMGASAFPLRGSVTGVDAGGAVVAQPLEFADAKIDLTGLEFSVGVIMTSRPRGRR